MSLGLTGRTAMLTSKLHRYTLHFKISLQNDDVQPMRAVHSADQRAHVGGGAWAGDENKIADQSLAAEHVSRETGRAAAARWSPTRRPQCATAPAGSPCRSSDSRRRRKPIRCEPLRRNASVTPAGEFTISSGLGSSRTRGSRANSANSSAGRSCGGANRMRLASPAARRMASRKAPGRAIDDFDRSHRGGRSRHKLSQGWKERPTPFHLLP